MNLIKKDKILKKKVLDQSLEKVENHMRENGLNDYPTSIFCFSMIIGI